MHTFDHHYDKTKGNFVIQVLAEILNTILIKGVFLKESQFRLYTCNPHILYPLCRSWHAKSLKPLLQHEPSQQSGSSFQAGRVGDKS